MDTINQTPAYSSRILPYALVDAVRLCDRLRVRCGGLLLGNGVSLRFLEHVSARHPAQLRLRDSSELLLPAQLELLSFDDDWCQVRVESRLPVARVGVLPAQAIALVENATDAVVTGVLGHYERTVR